MAFTFDGHQMNTVKISIVIAIVMTALVYIIGVMTYANCILPFDLDGLARQ